MPTKTRHRASVNRRRVPGSDPPAIAEARTPETEPSDEQAPIAARAPSASVGCRFVDPTICETELNKAEREFMEAMQDYKERSGRMFPTWSEVLEVLKNLGYQKVSTTG